MTARTWLIRLLLVSMLFIGLPTGLLMGFNYYIDPLWNFNHANDYNDRQMWFSERQQKTNYINTHPMGYDSLLMGTSRATYINQRFFKESRVYNYSLSALHIDDYKKYIDYASKKNGKPFKTIYIELYINSYNLLQGNTTAAPETFFEQAKKPFYRYTSLFSLDTLEHSIDNYKISKANYYDGPRSYTRSNEVQVDHVTVEHEKLWPEVKTQISRGWMRYDPDFKAKLQAIKDAYPDTKFVVFTDPVPAQRFDLILAFESHREAYYRFISEIVDVFGEVYSTQGHTAITNDLNNYMDWLHYYPNVAERIVQALENPTEHPDVVRIVNQANKAKYFEQLKAEMTYF
jgi:hypothetical protein